MLICRNEQLHIKRYKSQQKNSSIEKDQFSEKIVARVVVDYFDSNLY